MLLRIDDQLFAVKHRSCGVKTTNHAINQMESAAAFARGSANPPQPPPSTRSGEADAPPALGQWKGRLWQPLRLDDFAKTLVVDRKVRIVKWIFR
jgi:hypothetical protein